MKIDYAILVRNVYKSYFGKNVLYDINFCIERNLVTGLVGVNGVGKSTLIKIMLDLLKMDSGSVMIFGNKSTNSINRKNIFYLPEKFTPSALLTGIEFLEMSFGFHGIKYNTDVVKSCCEKFNFDDFFLKKRIGCYSKGMSQKLGIIAAFASNVNILIFDEPMSGLDPLARIELKNQISEYKKNGGTVFFSSHILADVDDICDIMVIINDGRICFNDHPKKLLNEFKTNNMEHAFLKKINIMNECYFESIKINSN